jgi:multidrug transporter EmrE-like cation transporter
MILIIVAITILASAADVLLKVGATRAGDSLTDLVSLAVSPWIWLGAAAGILAISLWVYVLSRHHISHAYPIFVGLNFLNISLASSIYLGETIPLARLAGILMVLAGIVIVHMFSQTPSAPVPPPDTGGTGKAA